ncbi:hypothetical protein [Streptomyces sp. GbtcB6]|uniref:hypothetical protein n=1 Tax=Streptomyces sp. GbtcB6 TaxID=2824751 RepID=UPI001C30A94F|nr:hypothetical protein [Streptomyces sp. GbtcB6]
MSTPLPSVGRIVHYVSHGTPVLEDGGQAFPSACRAAIVTEVISDPDHPDQVGLAVLNPAGLHLDRAVPYDGGGERQGDADCPDKESHGAPFRYCACGWVEASHRGGTWHWPERV